ncbi:GAF domain-containing protein [Planomonospora sp. ID82291]|uniref:sensor histidine kinase n=1 Tax=Planomonospora sp. ID82291 TaxID=2738136 RepID=UPI0018C35F9C|nr:GAF domain-containing protein [Planomonospora sp. ID82291]MBG0814593.1 GAF domain-containing protein [Planomonospora sp. ID82291]
MSATDRVHDGRRLRTLHATGLLEADGAPLLDRVTRLAVRWLGVPSAMVSLIDADRQVIVSAAGPVASGGGRRTPPPPSLGRHIVATDAPLTVPDARADARWGGTGAAVAGLPRSYAGVPLRSGDGQVLGALCVIDAEPRQWSGEQMETLEELAALAEAEIAVRLARTGTRRGPEDGQVVLDRVPEDGQVVLDRGPEDGQAVLDRVPEDGQAVLDRVPEDGQAVLDRVPEAIARLDAAGAVTGWNGAATRLFGWSAAEAAGRPLSELISPERLRGDCARLLRRACGEPTPGPEPHRLELTAADRSGREFPAEVVVQGRPGPGGTRCHVVLHDISDRHEARRRLEDEHRFMQALLDSLDVGVDVCDGDGRVILTNLPLRRIRPREPRALEEGETVQIFAADGRTPLRGPRVPLARALAGERIDGEEVIVRPPDIEPRRFVVNGRPIDAPDGRRLGAVVTLHDITVRHRAQTLRSAQHAVAQALADAGSTREAAAGVAAAVTEALGWTYGEYWQVDEDRAALTRLGLWTRPGRDLSSFTREHPDVFAPGEELPGTAWARDEAVWIADNAAAPHAFSRAQAALRAGLRSAMALPVRSGGQVLGVLVFAADHPQEPDDDLVDLLDGVCAHVGRYMERRRAEELTLALAASRRRFDQVVSGVSDNVWSVEVGADGSLHSMYQSRRATLFGRPLPESADVPDLIERRAHPEDRALYAAFLDTLRGGEPAEVEFRILGLDGVTRWLWMRATPRREGERMFIDGISTDVTDRHELAEQRERLLIQQRQQMERLRQIDELKNQFLRTVNHELRTPLASVRSAVQLMHDDGMDAATRERFLGVLDRNSVRLEHLLNELLLMASLNAGDVAFAPAETDLSTLARQAVRALAVREGADRLTVTVRAPAAVTAWADAGRLGHALAHLLDNAVKFTPAGGRVDVTVTADPVPSIEIADTGIGIDPQDLPHVCDDFYRGAAAERQAIGGTGVGLALVRKIVRMHGGDLRIESEPGGGTRVRLAFPGPAAAPPAD